MRTLRLRVASVTILTVMATGGCASPNTLDTFSTAQTCARADEVVSEIANILVKLALNPLAFEVYVDRLRELTADVSALQPLDKELKAALDDASTSADALLDATDLTDPSKLFEVPQNIAQLEIALGKVLEKCEQLQQA